MMMMKKMVPMKRARLWHPTLLALASSLAQVRTLTERLNAPGGALQVLMGNAQDAGKVLAALDRTNALLTRIDGLAAKTDTQLYGPGGLMPQVQASVAQLGGLLADTRATLKKVDAVLAEAQAIIEGQFLHAWLLKLVAVGLGHAGQLQLLEFALGLLVQHVERSFSSAK